MMNHQDQDELGEYNDVPFYNNSSTSQQYDHDFDSDALRLDSFITTNDPNHLLSSFSFITTNDSTYSPNETYIPRKNDYNHNTVDLFDDLISMTNPVDQNGSSTSNSTLNFESTRNKEFNFGYIPVENTRKKGLDQEFQENLIKIDLIQCQFVYPSKNQSSIKTTEAGDMAFLYRCDQDVVSVCFNKMQHEAAIPLSEIIGFCTNEGKILIKLKKSYQHSFKHHLGGFPYLLDPTPMIYDPSNNKFDGAQSLLLFPHSLKPSALTSLELRIERLYFMKHGIRNEAINDDGPKVRCKANESIAFPINAPFHRLLIVIESRFGKKSPTLSYLIGRDDLIPINNDETWQKIKAEASDDNPLLRLELHVDK
ncbi:16358_t:CDS:2 [Funneliformis geosporum]|uniref:9756_t:CDS:1 n=1 Tax=Funneliformis geosporum TaxID=1117311 RepID=A0A9W4SQJ2_9GLOM|nr:16358_t:CDS:2 [Funneliformis geosporum]CAI2177965.1 9756_t:CDS:2 [Funneliformis geosporum]